MTNHVSPADAEAKGRLARRRCMPRGILGAAGLAITLIAVDLAAPPLLGPEARGLTAPTAVRAAIPAAAGPCVAGWREIPV